MCDGLFTVCRSLSFLGDKVLVDRCWPAATTPYEPVLTAPGSERYRVMSTKPEMRRYRAESLGHDSRGQLSTDGPLAQERAAIRLWNRARFGRGCVSLGRERAMLGSEERSPGLAWRHVLRRARAGLDRSRSPVGGLPTARTTCST